MAIEITLPTDDRSLVSLEDAKAALGITGTSSDDAVLSAILRASDLISRQCGLDAVGNTPPSLKSEDITETFRGTWGCSLMLSRGFVSTIYMVTEGTAELGETDYFLQGRMLTRLRSDDNAAWTAGKIVVEYAAGFSEVPEDLQQICLDVIREQWSAASRDPLLRSETVDGVGRMDFQVGGLARDTRGALPPALAAALHPYRLAVI
jgi:hypothetical protein